MIFDKEHDQQILRYLHDKGMEMTPDELVVRRKIAYANIRRRLRAMGHEPPESDEALFELLQKFIVEGEQNA